MPRTSTLSQQPAGRRTESPGCDLSMFAVRVNRALTADVEHDIVIVTPSDLLETLRYQEIHLEVGRINDLLRQGGFQKLLVDLGKLTRLDGVVLTALVGFCRSLPTAAFCSASGDVRQSMQLASLVSLWPIYPTRATALAALSEPHPADAPPAQ